MQTAPSHSSVYRPVSKFALFLAIFILILAKTFRQLPLTEGTLTLRGFYYQMEISYWPIVFCTQTVTTVIDDNTDSCIYCVQISFFEAFNLWPKNWPKTAFCRLTEGDQHVGSFCIYSSHCQETSSVWLRLYANRHERIDFFAIERTR